MFGIGGSDSGGPMDYLRSRIENWRAHPFQNFASMAAGAVNPMLGLAAQQGFNKYNDWQNQRNEFMTPGMNQALNNSLQQTTMDANSAMNAPLSGALGAYDRQNPYGESGGSSSGMAGGGGYGGGLGLQNGYGGPTMSGQQWMDQTGGFQDIQNQLYGTAPRQSPLADALLNPISLGPGLPGSGMVGPQARRDNAGLNFSLFGGGPRSDFGGTVTNFQVGGAPVIEGINDPNGMFYQRRMPGQ